MLGNSALGQLALAEFPQKQAIGIFEWSDILALVDITDATLIPNPFRVIDTHDGVKKRKKKKPLSFDAELERTAKLRKQITEVIHPPVLVPVEEPETIPVPEVVEAKSFEIKTTVTPEINYADLARQEIVDKKQQEFLRQLELKRIADLEDEEELEMILEALL